MSWFQLDPSIIADRVKASGSRAEIPDLRASLRRGIVGFTLLSLAGYAQSLVSRHGLAPGSVRAQFLRGSSPGLAAARLQRMPADRRLSVDGQGPCRILKAQTP